MTLLKLENVVKRFGGLRAVDGVSLSLEKGEFLAVVGPNGSGKTTLLNLINGVYKPDGGRIYFEGRDITNMPPYKRARLGIARAFQVPRPFPELTVLDNVVVGAIFNGGYDKAKAREVAEEVLKYVGLYEKRDVLAGRLTFNELRLLELARALAANPKLLLLDEVMAGLNPGEIDAMTHLLKRLAEERGIAAISLVEHRMRAVAKLAHRVVVMHQGKIIAEGPPEKALSDPKVVEIYLGRPWR
ncbi:amino acid/amide ABC transporter ATP-binding protein 1, HAAT family [Pyrobaculum islandicum DSM 4184]|uniref:Probable branched-chain amino acid transport ATP-binding protein LivG n=1 Tax=Pyrobaculum islandicum (strain DSM 4184 / JCM 9189 / GEO3) TaxID=384616 RepID=A1RUP4_PYRIL|nr:ABC transporter ATP-binding protein [Pyrobaculum islandicum]ABL88676.1 amino acid/amide ABC transporter ATP-binding protein 1, HAAT family [Pyrobaculum islandicum DSM 4184]